MAFQGIDTSFQTPDTLLQGATKINSNFQEIYNTFGDGDVLFSSTSTIQVSEINSSNTATNIINGVGAIRFDQDSGFDVFDLGNGAVKISMNSTFKTWEVAGQPSLVAVGLDTVRFVAGENIVITTNISDPKSIRFGTAGILTAVGLSATGVVTATTFRGTLVGVASTAQNALTFGNQLPAYYLNYNNLINAPTNISNFVDDVGIATTFDIAALQGQINALGTNLNVVGFYDALTGIITSLTVVGQTRNYLGIGQTLASSGIQTGDYLIVSRGGTSVSPATFISPGITSAYSGDWIVGVGATQWSIISYSSQVVAPRATRSDFAQTLESNSNVNTTGIITATSFVGNGSALSGIITSILAGSNIIVDVTAGIATITSTASGVGAGTSVTISDTPPPNPVEGNLWYDSSIGRAFVYYNDGTSSQWVDFSPSYPVPDVDVFWNKTNTGINTLSNVGIGTTNATSTLTIIGNQYISGVVTSVNGFVAGTTTKAAYGSNNIVYDNDTFWGNIRFNSNNLELYPGGISDGERGDIVLYKKTAFGERVQIGRLDGNTGTLDLSGGVNSAGVITATTFIGDGSGLTNITATGSGVEIRDNNAIVGTASTINFGDNISVSPISAGVVTVTATSGGTVSAGGTWAVTSVGIHTLKNVGIGTTNATSSLTVKGNTSLETLNVSGVSTLNGSVNFGGGTQIISSGEIKLDNLSRIMLGYSGSTPNGLVIRQNSSSNVSEIVNVGGDDIQIEADSGRSVFIGNGNITNNLTVSGYGVTVTGSTLFAKQLSVSGVVTATTFIGNFSGSITDATNLTGGIATASQLRVTGVTTISQGRIQADASANLRFGNLPTGSGSVGRNIAIGDQVLSSLSGGQGRNIALGELSYYDTTSGQYNIGIGIKAGQKITTGSENVILGGYDGNSGNLDIRTLSGNVVIADGAGNIRQYINSSGNVGIKTTVVTEALTVAGVVSATSFYGILNSSQLTGALPAIDGSALIGVVGSGSGVIIQEDSITVGTAGTINFGSNLNVSFGSGIATVSIPSVSYATVAGVATVATVAQGLTGTPNITVSNVTANRLILPDCGNLDNGDNTEKLTFGTTPNFKIYHLNQSPYEVQNRIEVKTNPLYIGTIEEISPTSFYHTSLVSVIPSTTNARVELGFGASYPNTKLTTTGYGVSITGGVNATGIITASSFSGSASGLTNIPSGQLTGSLPAIDGSALLNVTASGTGIVIKDDNANVGSAVTVNFGPGLDVAFNAGVATVTASGGSLQSRTTVTGVTTSIANNGIGNTDIAGFKSYALLKVGLSTAAWLRLYTDSTSRSNDASRSQGEDPSPGSGVIAEVITTGISTTQIISPFVMGGNLDNPVDTTIYAAITNLSGSTQTITANLTILQLEA